MRKTLISLIAIALTFPLAAAFAQGNPPAATKTFMVSKDCTISLAEDKPGTLADLSAGDRVTIGFHTQGTTSVAERIHVMAKPKTGTRPPKSTDDDTHIHGIISAVDKTAGTVTIKVHSRTAKQPPAD